MSAKPPAPTRTAPYHREHIWAICRLVEAFIARWDPVLAVTAEQGRVEAQAHPVRRPR